MVLAAKFMLGETALWYEWLAFGVIFMGILMQMSWRQANKIAHVMPFVYMTLLGVFCAVQAMFDFAGIRASENLFSFIVALMFIGLPSTVLAFITHRKEIKEVLVAQKRQIIAVSLLDNIGYACFLYAIYVARVLYAVPLSNISVVIATLIGLYHLKESMRLRRIASAVLITAAISGVQLMNALGSTAP